MMKKFRVLSTMALVFLAMAVNNFAQADIVYSVSLDTSSLGSDNYGVAFQLIDGSGSNDNNNSAVISNFNFAGGNAIGTCPSDCSIYGDASGGLNSSVALNDSSFFNSFIQQFTLGKTLSFTVHLTTNVDSNSAPDSFAFSLLNSSGDPLSTYDDSGANTLFRIDINSNNPSPSVFGGVDGNLPAPLVSTVPEPSDAMLLLTGFPLVLWKLRKKNLLNRA